MDLQEAYLTLHQASGFEVGGKVKTLRLPQGNEHGWAVNSLANSHAGEVGKVGQITSDQKSRGFGVHGYVWPFFCLELIKKGSPPLKIGDNEVKFNDTGIKVGCQAVTKGQVKEIYKRLFD